LHEHHGDGIDGSTERYRPERDVSTVELHGYSSQSRSKEGSVGQES
jgi:hypothetical protein